MRFSINDTVWLSREGAELMKGTQYDIDLTTPGVIIGHDVALSGEHLYAVQYTRPSGAFFSLNWSERFLRTLPYSPPDVVDYSKGSSALEAINALRGIAVLLVDADDLCESDLIDCLENVSPTVEASLRQAIETARILLKRARREPAESQG